MAKDGTARGGQRVGSGRKKKPLVEKIQDGRLYGAKVIDDPVDIESYDMPPISDFLKAVQKNGKDLKAEEIYKKVWLWLKARGCEELVNNQLIEQYAMSVSRWVQCEESISEYGFIAKHPTTGGPIASPYVSMSQQYMKQANQIWYQIYQVVKDNCSVDFGGSNPQDDIMEHLLRARKGVS